MFGQFETPLWMVSLAAHSSLNAGLNGLTNLFIILSFLLREKNASQANPEMEG